MMKKEEGALRAEVSPTTLAIVIGVVVLLIGGYFVFQGMRGPKFLTGKGGSGAGGSMSREQRVHADPDTGLQTTKD